ncbi:MAG: hypothetical protein DHS20C14_05350 [Phycisphaeraceae bacterium]|nr:MAG: hypothetical protein DHS20C14_05350 [Phycisphaeraceae bacterium]
MTIEIYGAGFANKGAELMLRTVIARLRAHDPDLRLAVEPATNTPYERRAAERLSHVFPTVSLYPARLRRYMHRLPVVRDALFATAILPAGADRQCGLVRRHDIDGLIDISGYAYGDAFPWVRTRAGADVARAYAKRKKPVVLMPQMLGPFDKPKVRDQFKRLADHATLIYAREKPSFEAARALLGDDDRLRLAPDITIFSPKRDIDLPQRGRPYACIVPNERMLDQGRKEWGDTYLPRLLAAARALSARGVQPVVVVHSGDQGDHDLAERLVEELGPETDRFHHPDPFVLKAFIARSRLLVGSRFHAIVAALSSGVPGVALGWAHKYEALAADFGVPELQHRGTDDPEHLVELVGRICDDAEHDRLTGEIRDAKARMKTAIDGVWKEVSRLFGLGAGASA